MTNSPAHEKDWDQLFSEIEGLPGGIPQTQIRALAGIHVKASIEISRALQASTYQIKQFNKSTSFLTVVLIVLNILLLLSAVTQSAVVLLKYFSTH